MTQKGWWWIMGRYYGVVWSYGDDDSLSHHGIKGQRWGIRRYQNEDGTLTPLGRKRLGQNSDEVKTKLDEAKAKYREHQNHRNAVKASDIETVYRRLRRSEGHDPHDEYVAEADQIQTSMKKFDKLDSDKKKELGKRILDSLNRADDYYSDPDNYSDSSKWDDVAQRDEKIKDWLYEKSSSSIKKRMPELRKASNEDEGLSIILRDMGFDDSDDSRKKFREFLRDMED